MPWKNGLGTTTQLAIHPPFASLDSFEWRVSIARVRGSAPFSTFDGVERCLAMLRGEMTLLRNDAAPLHLTTESPPVSFAGNMSAEGRVESDTALDLNLMYRPAQWTATMHRIRLAEGRTAQAQPTTMLCALRAASLNIGERGYDLRPFDLLRIDIAASLFAVTALDAYMIALRTHQA